MCGKASVLITWKDVFAFARSLTPPSALPADPEPRINVSPSRLRRKSEPESMVWETLPVILADGETDQPGEAIWPFLPPWSPGRLPTLKNGRTLSTANARFKPGEKTPFAPTFMTAWKAGERALVPVSWFYEFDGRTQPKIPYAVFPLNDPCWLMAGLTSWTEMPDGERRPSVAIITVDPNGVLESVGHNRSPALLRNGDEARTWLRGPGDEALGLLRPYPNETMGVEKVPDKIKIPGNQDVRLPGILSRVAMREIAG